MDKPREPTRQPASGRSPPSKLTARQEREAAALRANLHKRKDQARVRGQPKEV